MQLDCSSFVHFHLADLEAKENPKQAVIATLLVWWSKQEWTATVLPFRDWPHANEHLDSIACLSKETKREATYNMR